jgi:transcriptional regulator with XRE-family HTH domain
VKKVKMTPRQCKAARALLGWDQTKLAEAIGNSINVVSMFERGMFDRVASRTMDRMQEALEEEGISFIHKVGVMLMPNGDR